MICILARDRNPEYYEQLKEVLTGGLSQLTDDMDCCCCDGYRRDCEYSAICGDVLKAIVFLESEQLRAELKRQKRLP